MIRGAVNARREAVATLRVRGPTGIEAIIEAVIDTGFSAALTLPTATITDLELIRFSAGSAVLADGSSRPFDIYAAEVEWDGAWRSVLVSAVGIAPLLGMGILAGSELRIEVVLGGGVEITPLP